MLKAGGRYGEKVGGDVTSPPTTLLMPIPSIYLPPVPYVTYKCIGINPMTFIECVDDIPSTRPLGMHSQPGRPEWPRVDDARMTTDTAAY